MNNYYKYGSVEFYKEQFGDILADVGDAPMPGDEDLMNNIVQGFLLSCDDWLKYHEKAAKRYAATGERIRQALAL